MMTTLFLSLSFASGCLCLFSAAQLCASQPYSSLRMHVRSFQFIARIRTAVQWNGLLIRFLTTPAAFELPENTCWEQKFSNSSTFLSQKPINDNHLDQVDESWYLNETRDKTSPGIHLRWNMFLIWDQTLAFTFLLYHLRRLVKNWTSYFITGSKHLETNESSRPIASCFHLSLGVWNPWWSTCPRSWHITSNTVWLQTSQRFCFFFFFSFSIFFFRQVAG